MTKNLRFVVLLAVAGLLAASIFNGREKVQETIQDNTPSAVDKSAPNNTKEPQTGTSKNSSEVVNEPSYGAVPVASSRTVNYSPEKRNSKKTFTVEDRQYDLITYKATLSPNDPSATDWWVTQTGLPAAWEYSTGINTKIAVIDTGFALQHEEFSNRWLDNLGESGATSIENSSQSKCSSLGITLNKSCNGIDDDSNGLIDDFRGWDFYSDDPNVQAGELNPDGAAAWHGTAVAGVAAASGNNGVGIAGVNWGAKVLPIQALSDEGVGDTLSISRAIRYAADRKVDVINLSLGADTEDSYLRQSIQYALQKGVIVVAASGNDGCDCISYPANYSEVVAVGASNSSGTTASYSSYGKNLDVVAPGSAIKSAGWNKTNNISAYITASGTSFAAPYISGLLANIRSAQPASSWGQIIHTVFQTADHRTLTTDNPRSNSIGFGYARADNAQIRASTPYIKQMRYAFTLDNRDVLSAPTANECEAGQFPTASFYELKEGRSIYYSMSDLTVYQQKLTGTVVSQKGYVCTGLQTDKFDTVRLMDPAREFSNKTDK